MTISHDYHHITMSVMAEWTTVLLLYQRLLYYCTTPCNGPNVTVVLYKLVSEHIDWLLFFNHRR